MEDKFNTLIIKIVQKNSIKVKSVTYQVATSKTTRQSTPVSITKPATQNNNTLNSRYTFSNFVVGSSNELAYAACQSIVKEPGAKYNPLFLYGGVGLGKTHLIQAVGNEILRNNSQAKVLYTSSERFANEFIVSILKKQNFSQKYRNADVLIVDDMQFIAGKEKTQEEFFHTFNALHQANKQIIISSDKPPKAIPTLEERLRSRFEWGMTVDIQPPDFETRIAIVHTKANRNQADLDEEIVEYLATYIKSNIRELEGALTKLMAYCEVSGKQPSLEICKQVINPPHLKHRHVTPRSVVDKTARFFNIPIEELTGPRRDRDIVEPRQIAMYLLRVELHLSFPQIAKYVGRNDHTTAMHSVSKIEQALANNHYLRQKIYELKEKLYV